MSGISLLTIIPFTLILLASTFGLYYKGKKEDVPIFSLAAMPYICLVVNEGYQWCQKATIQLPIFKSKDTLEKIRAKGKLFANDKYLSFDQQYVNIENLVRIEHAYYKSLAKPNAPDFLINDVGTYWINNVCVGNTIQYAYDFSPFSKSNKSIYDSGKEIYEFSVEMGSACQQIITILTGYSYIIKNNHSDNMKQHSCLDFAYKRSFKSIDNIILYSIICRINFLLYYFKKHIVKVTR